MGSTAMRGALPPRRTAGSRAPAITLTIAALVVLLLVYRSHQSQTIYAKWLDLDRAAYQHTAVKYDSVVAAWPTGDNAPSGVAAIKAATVVATVHAVEAARRTTGMAADPDSQPVRCATMRDKHGVVPHVTWGSLPADEQDTWTSLKCDTLSAGIDVGEPAGDPVAAPVPKVEQAVNRGISSAVTSPRAGAARRRGMHRKRRRAQTDDAADDAADSDAARCKALRIKHGVLVGTSWGSLPLSGQRLWQSLDCDSNDPYREEQWKAEKVYLTNYSMRHTAGCAVLLGQGGVALAGKGVVACGSVLAYICVD